MQGTDLGGKEAIGGAPEAERREALRLLAELRESLAGAGVALPGGAELSRRVVARLGEGARGASAEDRRARTPRARAWAAVRAGVLEGLRNGAGRGEGSGAKPGWDPAWERMLEILDDLPDLQRFACLERWLRGASYREIAVAIREKAGCEVSHFEIGEALLAAHERLGGVTGEANPPGRKGECRSLRSTLGRLAHGESVLDRHGAAARQHLRDCPGCAALLEGIRSGDRAGAETCGRAIGVHPGVDDLESYARAMEPSPARRALIERHLEDCGGCERLLQVIRFFERTAAIDLIEYADRMRARRRALWVVLVTLALAAGIGAGVAGMHAMQRGRVRAAWPNGDVRELIPQAGPGAWPRIGLPREEDPDWKAGLAALGERRWEEAAGRFGRYAAARPEDCVGQLFAGVALVLSGEPATGRIRLARGDECGDARLAEETRFWEGLAGVALGEETEARRALHEVSVRGQARAGLAREILGRLP